MLDEGHRRDVEEEGDRSVGKEGGEADMADRCKVVVEDGRRLEVGP